MSSILHSGEFLDYENNTIRVTFYTDSTITTGKTNDLKFTGKLPVVINKNGQTDNIFEALHTTSCDISIVSSKILSDLYTTDKTGIKLKVEKISKQGTTRLFEGYMTPNTYSQHISPNLDNIDMTAICPIATLKYLRVDDILEKSKTITIGELLGKSLAEVKIDADLLEIEDSVFYEDDIRLVDMMLQTSNFWDEGDDPETLYDVVSECLRLFGYTMTFTGEKYIIYMAIADHNITTRKFRGYKIQGDGSLKYYSSSNYDMTKFQFKHDTGEWTTIDDNPTISIDTVYDRIDGVASTKIPDYSTSAFDLIDVEDRDKYDAADLNVARNKIKGYYSNGITSQEMTGDEWYYLWNGVYASPDYGLEITGNTINGFANINAAYKYLTGQDGNPNSYGGILNFYGGEDNPTGIGRDPQEERPVDVKSCITVFAPDNGVPPEFLERSDLAWTYSKVVDNQEESYNYDPEMYKKNSNNARYGVNKTGIADGVSYKQILENITIIDGTDQTLNIDISQSYSRTGINQNISISNYSTIEDKFFQLDYDDENEEYRTAILTSGIAYYYPPQWDSDSLTVQYGYFNNYKSGTKLKPVWDKRKIYAYIVLLDGTKYQFNGKNWVATTAISDANAFYLMKLMNNTKIFKDDFRYDLIECADGEIYSFDENGWYSSSHENGVDFDKSLIYKYYADINNEWAKYIDDCGEGRISIKLPATSGVNITVGCEIYHSNLLGITGNNTSTMPNNLAHTVLFKIEGKYSYNPDPDMNYDPVIANLTPNVTANYGKISGSSPRLDFMPINATYIKAEHLDIDISLSVPEGNLGQMFGESDIKYQTASSKKFRESYDAPEFLVNTKHDIVTQSHSYLIINNGYADPAKFKIGCNNMLYCRPENYVMQGYKNYLGKIRKQYNRVLVPNKEGFSNTMVFIEAPDIPNDGNGRWLMVVSDSNDVKTNRHTISAVEDYGIAVTEINNYTIIEIPRKSRNPRYDLPSVQKK